jgi:flagellar operon protein
MSPVQLNNSIPGVGIGQSGQTQRKPALRQAQDGANDFAGALQSEVAKQGGVKMSAHAARRLADRNVEFSANDQARLEAAVDRIESKGADKSLVLMDDLALLVSARNRVVITALDSASAKDGVFTNIDSAVII